MGRVFLGHDRLLDRPVALKFISPTNPDPRARERFVTEARCLARIEHPNVVSVYRISQVDEQPYIAYEFVDGTALSRLARPMSWRKALAIAVGIARGLAAVHERGLLHRDIKPANVVVGKNQTVKLIDFGLAEPHLDFDEPSRAWMREQLNAEHASGSPGDGPEGTPIYMAPELSGGEPWSARSDLYAVGVVMWELLVGDLPHTELTNEEMAARLVIEGLPAIGSVRRDLPAPLAAIIDQCTARNPERRPRSAAALRDRLETLRAIYAPLLAAPDDDAVAESKAGRRLVGSFERVAAHPEFAARLHHHLAEGDPELHARFPGFEAMHPKLVAALHTVVRSASAPEMVVPLLEDLGFRHQEYGVQPADLERMVRALVATIGELDAARWTPALHHLWERTFLRIAGHIRRGMARAAAELSGSYVVGGAGLGRELPLPEPRFARADGGLIAYQSVGEGPRELVVVPGWVSHLELAWQEPGFARLMARLSRRGRVTVHDRRGTGLSERDVTELDVGRQVGDLLAVLDAAGIERAILVALGDGATVALLFAAMYPERVRALVLWGAAAQPRHEPAAVDAWVADLRAHWGEPAMLEQLAPSRLADEGFRGWWSRFLRSGTTPTAAAALMRARAEVDLRCILTAIRVRTLVLRRTGDRVASRAEAVALADGIEGATYVELDGDDHLIWAADPDRVASEIDGFISELPTSADNPARLVTVMTVRGGEHDLARRLHAAVESERGIVVDDPRGTVAVFRAPTAAVRALRAADTHGTSRVAILAEVVPSRDLDAETVLIDAAWTLVSTTRPGQLCLSPVARDLLGDAALGGLDAGQRGD